MSNEIPMEVENVICHEAYVSVGHSRPNKRKLSHLMIAVAIMAICIQQSFSWMSTNDFHAASAASSLHLPANLDPAGLVRIDYCRNRQHLYLYYLSGKVVCFDRSGNVVSSKEWDEVDYSQHRIIRAHTSKIDLDSRVALLKYLESQDEKKMTAFLEDLSIVKKLEGEEVLIIASSVGSMYSEKLPSQSEVRVIDLQTQKCTLTHHTAAYLHDLDFDPSSNRIFLATSCGIESFNMTSGERKQLSDMPCCSLEHVPQHNLVIGGLASQTLIGIDKNTGDIRWACDTPIKDNSFATTCTSADGSSTAINLKDSHIPIIDPRTGVVTQKLPQPLDTNHTMRFVNESNQLLALRFDGSGQIWNVANGSVVEQLQF